MAHELDRNALTELASVFSYRQSMWHNEGFVTDRQLTLDEAMTLAGHRYTIEMHDVAVNLGNEDEPYMVKTPEYRAIVRKDTGKIFGIASRQYEPFSNVDYFENVLRPLMDRGAITLETGGTLREGRDAWMLAKFNLNSPIVEEVFRDEVVPYACLLNNHSMEGKVLLFDTPIRVVCANTLATALGARGNTIAVPHRIGVGVKVVEAAERIFSRVVEQYEGLAIEYKALKERFMTQDEFVTAILDTVAPFPPEYLTTDTEHLTSRGYDKAYSVAEDRRARITHMWHHGSGHKGDDSAWEAYNGAVEVLDHDIDLFKTKGSRVASTISGRLAERKTDLYNAVMELVA